MISLGVPGVEFLPLLPCAGLRRVCPGDPIGVGSRMCEGTVRGSRRAGMASAPSMAGHLLGAPQGWAPWTPALLGSGSQGFPGEGGVALPLPSPPLSPRAVHTPSPRLFPDHPLLPASFSDHLIAPPLRDPSQQSRIINFGFGVGGFFTFVLFFILYRELFFSKASFDCSNFSGAVNLFLFLIYFPSPRAPQPVPAHPSPTHTPLAAPSSPLNRLVSFFPLAFG